MSDDEYEPPIKCGYCDIILRECCVDEEGVQQFYEPLVLPCGHEACTHCLPVLKKEGRPCPRDGCRAVGLCEPGESEPQALARKRAELTIVEDKQLALQLRTTLALDNNKATYTKKRETAMKRAQKAYELAAYHLVSSSERYNDGYMLFVSGHVSEVLFGKFRSSEGYYTFEGLRSRSKEVLRDKLCLDRFGITSAQVNAIEANGHSNSLTWTPDYVYCSVNSWSAGSFIVRFCFATRALEIGDWPVPASSEIRLDDGRIARSQAKDKWIIDGSDPQECGKSIAALDRNEAKRADAIRKEHLASEEEIAREIKMLDCDIEALEMRIKDSGQSEIGPLAGRDAPFGALAFVFDSKVGRTFGYLEKQFTPLLDYRYWPSPERIRGNITVFPLSERYAAIWGKSRLALVDLVGDVHKPEPVEAGRRTFVLSYGEVVAVLVVGDVVWVRDKSGVVEAYSMSRLEQLSADPPTVTFPEVSAQKTLVPDVMADFTQIRTRVWLRRTPGSCIRALGSVLY